MATFDFVFMAEYAKALSDGTLIATGIGFDRVTVQPGPVLQLAVAGRIRGALDETDALIRVTVRNQNVGFSMAGELRAVLVQVQDQAHTSTVFALNLGLPATTTGLTEVSLELGDTAAELAFTVARPEQ